MPMDFNSDEDIGSCLTQKPQPFLRKTADDTNDS